LRGGWIGELRVAPRILLAVHNRLVGSQLRSLLRRDNFDLVEAGTPSDVASELSKKPDLDLLIIDSTLYVPHSYWLNALDTR
jgi:PleD family two-component response regulator